MEDFLENKIIFLLVIMSIEENNPQNVLFYLWLIKLNFLKISFSLEVTINAPALIVYMVFMMNVIYLKFQVNEGIILNYGNYFLMYLIQCLFALQLIRKLYVCMEDLAHNSIILIKYLIYQDQYKFQNKVYYVISFGQIHKKILQDGEITKEE